MLRNVTPSRKFMNCEGQLKQKQLKKHRMDDVIPAFLQLYLYCYRVEWILIPISLRKLYLYLLQSKVIIVQEKRIVIILFVASTILSPCFTVHHVTFQRLFIPAEYEYICIHGSTSSIFDFQLLFLPITLPKMIRFLPHSHLPLYPSSVQFDKTLIH